MTDTAEVTETAEPEAPPDIETVPEEKAVPQEPAGEEPSEAVEPPKAFAGVVLNRLSLLVGVITFVVLLSAMAGAFVFVVRKPAARPPKVVAPPPVKAETGQYVYQTLIDRYTFSAPLPPMGNRTVVFEYSLAVKIDKADQETFKQHLEQQQLMLKCLRRIKK